MKIINCICCNSTNLKLILDLGNQPWCNNFLTKEEINKEEYYPLQLMQCQECKFIQLSYFVPKEKMFSKHDYLSGTTKTLRKHFKEVAENIINFIEISKTDLIVDIGGNDGTNLEVYKELGYQYSLNVEAAHNIAEISYNKGINTINHFFNENLVDEWLYFGKEKAKIINASGVFFHLEEIHSVLRGIKKLLNNDGVLIVQFMYVIDMIKNLSFDMIYHEHLFYYTLQTLENLLKLYNLEIVHCYHSNIHSGSMIAYIKHSSPRNNKTDDYWENMLHEHKFLEKNTLEEFAKNIENVKTDLKQCLEKILFENPKSLIYGLGAPAKSSTLLNYFGINNEHIKKIYEVNELKIGKYTPMSHIYIEKENYDDIPDYFLVLAHNFFDEIINKNKKFQEKGVKFIMPFPNIKII